MAAILPRLALVVMVTATSSSASLITFEKTPNVIHTVLTKQMTLTCRVKATVTSQSGSLVGRRSVEKGQGNIQFLTSMVVLRDGKNVATVTLSSPPTAVQDTTTLDVTGSVSKNQGELGHLTLTWSYPDEKQSGNYTCEVNGIGVTGHSITMVTSVNMPVSTPDVAALTKYVHDQQVEIDDQKMKNQALQQQMTEQKTQILALIDSRLQDLRQEIDQSQDQMAALYNESRHIENGTEVCGGSNGWSSSGIYRSKEVTVNFRSSYKSPPVVHVSASKYDQYFQEQYSAYSSSSYSSNRNRYNDRYFGFWTELVNVTETSFSLRCKTRSDSTYTYLVQFEFAWISLP